MEREVLFSILAASLFGTTVWALAIGMSCTIPRLAEPEPRAWWRLVFPLFIGALVLAFVLGWATQEPDPADERASTGLVILAGLSGTIGVRALWRSLWAISGAFNPDIPIGTVGLLKPTIVMSQAFQDVVGPEVRNAALAHEAAHARGRDPLRIWFAQLAADLQWPIPSAHRRLDAWLLALEALRDDDAVVQGAPAVELAEAILAAARLQGTRRTRAVVASAAGVGAGVAWRVRRLLKEDRCAGPRPLATSRWRSRIACAGLLWGAVWLGVWYGDVLLAALPGLRR